MRGQLFGVAVHAARQARQVGGSQCGGLHHLRPHHRNTQQVGLKLHEQVVDAGPAVHAQFTHRLASSRLHVTVHGLQQGGALESNAFQGRSCDVGDGGASRQAHDGTAGIGVPVRGPQAREGRHKHHTTGVGHALRQTLHLAAGLNGMQAISQPLHHSAADEDAAFQGILRLKPPLGRTCGQQTVGTGLGLRAGVHEHEAPGAIGVFGQARLEARLSKQRTLLVTRDATNGDLIAQPLSLGASVIGAGGQHLGQHLGRHFQGLQQGLVPLARLDVEEQGARGVADVGGVDSTARELPNEPAVHGAKSQLPRLGGGACTWHMVQDPRHFGAREVRVQDEPGSLLEKGFQTLGPQRRAGGLGAPVLPHDGMVQRLACAAVPHHRGLALIGDANAGDVAGLQSGVLQCLSGRGQLGLPDFRCVMFHPARLRVNLTEFALRHGHDAALAIKDDAA